jgi:GTP-binding protein
LVDLTSTDPISDYQVIQEELRSYGRGLAERPQILVLNKSDAAIELEQFQQNFSKLTPDPILVISAVTRLGLDELMQVVWQKLEQVELD